jgi:hypothetical protein
MSSLMSGLAGALGGGDAGGYAPPAPADDSAQGGGGETYSNSLDALDGAEEALHAFIKLDPDQADRAVAAQCLQNVLKLKAANQQSQQNGDMKGLQRALLSGGGPGAGTVG